MKYYKYYLELNVSKQIIYICLLYLTFLGDFACLRTFSSLSCDLYVDSLVLELLCTIYWCVRRKDETYQLPNHSVHEFALIL